MKSLLITYGLLFCTFASQAQSAPADSPKPVLLAWPHNDSAGRRATARAEAKAYRLSHPCPYAKQEQRPNCVDGHQEGIIPVVYGLSSHDNIEREKRGEIKLRGCKVSGCDPNYYCIRHQKYL